jgi:hypothetical protein
MTEKSKTIHLVERAFALPNSDKEFGMKIADHKLLCSVLDAHLEVTQQKIDKQNNLFEDKLLKDVVEVIQNELRPFKEENERAHAALKTQIAEIDRRTNDKRVWTIRVLVSVVTILLAVVIAIILFISYHNKYLTTGEKFKLFRSEYSIWADNWKQVQIRGVSPITRSVGNLDLSKFTKKQQDSIHDAGHTQNQREIMIGVERRNKEYNDKYRSKTSKNGQ